MTFNVNPNTATNARRTPLEVTAGATIFTPFAQLTGTSPLPDSYPKAMFVRVAMTGDGPPPSLYIRAGGFDNPSPLPVELPSPGGYTIRTTNRAFQRATDQDVGDVQLFTNNELSNVQRFIVNFYSDSTESFELGIRNNHPTETRKFTWFAAQTVDETVQPWLAVSTAPFAFDSLANRPLSKSVPVTNHGTAPITVDGTSAPFPASLAFTNTLPLALDPGRSADLTLNFNPAGQSSDAVAVNVTTTPNDTFATTVDGHNKQITGTANAQELEVVLLLDDSGSMGTDALGGFLPPGSLSSRWAELTDGAKQFLDLLATFGAGRGKFGVARFPSTSADPSTYDLVPMQPITDNMTDAKNKIEAVEPFNSTPMGDGLNRVLGPGGYFSDNKNNRRWLILMSDGKHNSGTHLPAEFMPPALSDTTSMKGRKITMWAIGYGIEGFTDVDHVLLKALADSSLGGQVQHVGTPGTTATDLAAKLRDAIKAGLTPATASSLDPAATFVIGDGEARHDATLTQYDERAAFVLNWNTPDPTRLRLELVTPDCQVITPENAGTGRFYGVTFTGTNRSNMYVIDRSFLHPDDGGVILRGEGGSYGGTRPGTWTFRVTSPQIIIPLEGAAIEGGVDTENYRYDVLLESTLDLQLSQDTDTHYAGDPIKLSAQLAVDGKPIRNAAVSVSTTKPTESFTNFVTGLVIPADALARARKELEGKDASDMLIKQRAAQIAGLVFGGGTDTRAVPMVDADGDGTYQATIFDTSVPESYTFYVTAFGVTTDGVPFRREGKIETHVLVRPDAASTTFEVNQVQPGVSTVQVIPKDRFGNVLLADPATLGGQFSISAPDSQVAPIISHLDGTYTTTVTYDPKSTPQIGFEYGGVQVIDPIRVVPLGELKYPNRVVDFDPGREKKANQHKDAKDALGDVSTKPADKFVALGAYGDLTLGFSKQLILAEADDDVTVFVAPSADRRGYRVDAFDLRHSCWRELGSSSGTTASFGLKQAGLLFTPAIRIADISGRARGDDGKPLTAPGVGIRGMGVLRTTRDLPHGHWKWPDWWNRD